MKRYMIALMVCILAAGNGFGASAQPKSLKGLTKAFNGLGTKLVEFQQKLNSLNDEEKGDCSICGTENISLFALPCCKQKICEACLIGNYAQRITLITEGIQPNVCIGVIELNHTKCPFCGNTAFDKIKEHLLQRNRKAFCDAVIANYRNTYKQAADEVEKVKAKLRNYQASPKEFQDNRDRVMDIDYKDNLPNHYPTDDEILEREGLAQPGQNESDEEMARRLQAQWNN